MTTEEYKINFNCFTNSDLTLAINHKIVGEVCDFRYQDNTKIAKKYNYEVLVEVDMIIFENTIKLIESICNLYKPNIIARYDNETGNSMLLKISGLDYLDYELHTNEKSILIATLKFGGYNKAKTYVITNNATEQPLIENDAFTCDNKHANYKVEVSVPYHCTRQELVERKNAIEYNSVFKIERDPIFTAYYNKFDYKAMREDLAIYSNYNCTVIRNGKVLYGGIVREAAKAVKDIIESEEALGNDTDTEYE